MISNLVIKSCPYVCHVQVVDQKIRKLVNIFLELPEFEVQAGVVKQFTVIIPDKARAGGAGYNHGPIMVEFEDEFLSYGFCIIPESAVKTDLAATGLILVVNGLNIKFLKDLDHVEARLRV